MRKKWIEKGVAAAAGVACVLLARDAWPDTKVGGGIGYFLAAVAFIYAVIGGLEADCPACGRAFPTDAVGDSKFERCPHCAAYLRRDAGKLTPLPADFSAPEAAFAVPVEGRRLPGLCGVCAEPATKRVTIVVDYKEKILPGYAADRKFEYEAPYCARHEAGARIEVVHIGPKIGIAAAAQGETENLQVCLVVPSYRFYRAAMGLN